LGDDRVDFFKHARGGAVLGGGDFRRESLQLIDRLLSSSLPRTQIQFLGRFGGGGLGSGDLGSRGLGAFFFLSFRVSGQLHLWDNHYPGLALGNFLNRRGQRGRRLLDDLEHHAGKGSEAFADDGSATADFLFGFGDLLGRNPLLRDDQ